MTSRLWLAVAYLTVPLPVCQFLVFALYINDTLPLPHIVVTKAPRHDIGKRSPEGNPYGGGLGVSPN